MTYWHPDSLRGHVAIVTGAARGVGRGIAAALLERGAQVLLVDIDADQLASTLIRANRLPNWSQICAIPMRRR